MLSCGRCHFTRSLAALTKRHLCSMKGQQITLDHRKMAHRLSSWGIEQLFESANQRDQDRQLNKSSTQKRCGRWQRGIKADELDEEYIPQAMMTRASEVQYKRWDIRHSLSGDKFYSVDAPRTWTKSPWFHIVALTMVGLFAISATASSHSSYPREVIHT